MKRYTYIVLLFIIAINISSCKKSFLQVEDKSDILREQYVKDLKSTEDFLNGVYVLLTKDLYTATNQVYPELIADNIKPKSGSSFLLTEYKWEQRPDMGSISLNQYRIVKACSFVIEKAAVFRNEEPSKSDNLKAQALAIRALVNFIITNAYAQSYNFTADASHLGIALVKTYDPFEPIAGRNTVKEVYDAIIEDLNTSISLFSSENISSSLVFNKIAARALLARVFLFKGEYAAAKNLAVGVLNQVPIMTTDYPANLFTPSETEALFQLAPSSPNVVAGAFATTFQGRYFQGSNSQVQFLATADIATLLTQDPLDLRSAWVTNVSGNWRISKYPIDVVPGFSPTTQSYYPTILRSSEMCLLAAEASAKLNMENDAITYLDAIRMRANPTAAATTATGNDLLELIYTERRKELAFEGLRMFDLLRWKKAVNRGSDVTNGAMANLPYPSSKAIAPIPITDVQIMGLQQNPSY